MEVRTAGGLGFALAEIEEFPRPVTMAHELHDYLGIDEDQARLQWRAILDRPMPQSGRRQEPFRPIEVVLCHGLFRLLDPRRFGGANIHLLPEEAKVLAATFRRPPGSLTNKMLNLAFERAHGAHAEPELFLRLNAEPDRFLRLYRTILDAARTVGLGDDRVPDFLGVEQGLELLGQEELGHLEIGVALAERLRDQSLGTLRRWLGESGTERLVEQRVRLGQHRFAAAVLDAFDRRCGFCGFSPVGLEARGMLIASHVKPWAVCANDRERLDPRNGIAACPTHDRAFDTGLLTVNGGLRIHRAGRLVERMVDPATQSFFGAGVVGERLVLGARGVGPGKRYLDYHKTHVFRGAG